MQTVGYVTPHGEKIKVLYRLNITGKYASLRKRETGGDGIFFEDETAYLEENPAVLDKLKDGQVISL